LANSSAEVGFLARRFGIPEAKLRFVPMHTTIANPERAPENEGYVLSIGRSGRDWETLLRAAPLLAAPLRIVAGAADRLPEPLPPNVQVLRDVPLEQSRDWMKRAAVVVVPLLPAERSTGQVVLFEAMALGKRSSPPAPPAPSITSATRKLPAGRTRRRRLLATAINRLLRDAELARRLSKPPWPTAQRMERRNPRDPQNRSRSGARRPGKGNRVNARPTLLPRGVAWMQACGVLFLLAGLALAEGAAAANFLSKIPAEPAIGILIAGALLYLLLAVAALFGMRWIFRRWGAGIFLGTAVGLSLLMHFGAIRAADPQWAWTGDSRIFEQYLTDLSATGYAPARSSA
jgi:hypothetical protein